MRANVRGSFGADALRGQNIKVRRNLKDLRFFFNAALAVVVFAGVVFVYLSSRLMVVKLGYEISKMNEAKAAESDRNRRLRFELTRLKSPSNLERIVKEETGLDYPGKHQIMRVK
ncbi:MAG TPA: hypothetical protein VFF54_03970 [Thermodesulfobacteriota bacterium]|nr:hypothetical protein [Thermodesulfobacteriota bacterium]